MKRNKSKLWLKVALEMRAGWLIYLTVDRFDLALPNGQSEERVVISVQDPYFPKGKKKIVRRTSFSQH